MDKLDFKKIGPYQIIEKCRKSSYLLKLPPLLKCLHPVFHISLLEPFKDATIIPNQIQDSSITQVNLAPDATTNPEISTILDSRKIGHRHDYLIHWKGLPDSENSWTPFAEISTSLYPYLEQFHHCNPNKPHLPCFQITNTPSDSIPIPIPTSAIDYNTAQTMTPPPEPWLPTYKPPSHSIMRTGWHVHPPKSKDL